jgi:transposase
VPPSKGQKANRPEAGASRKPRNKSHAGVARGLAENPDHVRDVFADRCEGCGTVVSEAEQTHVRSAYDHIDLPPLKPIVTRVVLHACACRNCGKRVAAPAPADMPEGSPFGPNIQALVVYMRHRHNVSYGRLVELLDEVAGLEISEGAIANMLARAGPAFAAQAAEIEKVVRASPVIMSDETSARIDGRTWWQWVFGFARAVLHRIVPSRAKAVATDFLAGTVPEVWVSDRLASQMGHARLHQFCLAHLIRDAQYAIDAGDDVFAPGFKALLQRACVLARRRPDLADSTLSAYARDLDRRLDRLLATKPVTRKASKLRAAMELDRDKLFVFMRRRDVDPTNNASERDLRPSVTFRKVTGGFRSEWGAEVYADIRSTVATGLRNGRTALASIRDALAGRSVLTPA